MGLVRVECTMYQKQSCKVLVNGQKLCNARCIPPLSSPSARGLLGGGKLGREVSDMRRYAALLDRCRLPMRPGGPGGVSGWTGGAVDCSPPPAAAAAC